MEYSIKEQEMERSTATDRDWDSCKETYRST